MPEPPRRKRFQIHLSTAIVLMFVAGGLIWANMLEAKHDVVKEGGRWHISDYGWPAPALHSKRFIPKREFSPHLMPETRYQLIYGLATADLFLAMFILFTVWFLCEWQIRRRAARKGP